MTVGQALKTLGLTGTVTLDLAKQAYRSHARRWHPDVAHSSGSDKPQRAESRIRKINAAWEVLEPVLRAAPAGIRPRRPPRKTRVDREAEESRRQWEEQMLAEARRRAEEAARRTRELRTLRRRGTPVLIALCVLPLGLGVWIVVARVASQAALDSVLFATAVIVAPFVSQLSRWFRNWNDLTKKSTLVNLGLVGALLLFYLAYVPGLFDQKQLDAVTQGGIVPLLTLVLWVVTLLAGFA